MSADEILGILLGLSLMVNGFILGAFLSFLRDYDHRQARDRANLLQRIQSPISAVAQHAEEQQPEDSTGTFTLPFDDDKAMQDFLGVSDGD